MSFGVYGLSAKLLQIIKSFDIFLTCQRKVMKTSGAEDIFLVLLVLIRRCPQKRKIRPLNGPKKETDDPERD